MADAKPNAKTSLLPLWTPSLTALWVLTLLAVAGVAFAVLVGEWSTWLVATSFVITTTSIWIRRLRSEHEC